jgi:hypothetical protein
MKRTNLNQSYANHERNKYPGKNPPHSGGPEYSKKLLDSNFNRRKLRVEEIEVFADKNYMYCRGKLRSRISRVLMEIVVAIEWFDKYQQLLQTNWKRLDMRPDGISAPSTSGEGEPFIVKCPLDRRVRSVRAYAFSNSH